MNIQNCVSFVVEGYTRNMYEIKFPTITYLDEESDDDHQRESPDNSPERRSTTRSQSPKFKGSSLKKKVTFADDNDESNSKFATNTTIEPEKIPKETIKLFE